MKTLQQMLNESIFDADFDIMEAAPLIKLIQDCAEKVTEDKIKTPDGKYRHPYFEVTQRESDKLGKDFEKLLSKIALGRFTKKNIADKIANLDHIIFEFTYRNWYKEELQTNPWMLKVWYPSKVNGGRYINKAVSAVVGTRFLESGEREKYTAIEVMRDSTPFMTPKGLASSLNKDDMIAIIPVDELGQDLINFFSKLHY